MGMESRQGWLSSCQPRSQTGRLVSLTDNDKLLLDQMATLGGNASVVRWIARYCSRPLCAKAG